MQLNKHTPLTTSSLVELMDKHLWNDQTEVVDALFPEAEEQHPEAARWFELKDTRPTNLKQLKARGAAVLCLGTHAWIGLPADPVSVALGIDELMPKH
ncbi:hypothetical protein [Comamonas aquatica]|uniref:hypothetical protein n=1 Tax=Comamonas aquatica TaxID=225991 RepID=UPI0012E0259D|nr:hypothetical protein [Comamonas aquatica]